MKHMTEINTKIDEPLSNFGFNQKFLETETGHAYRARIVPTILLHFLLPWRSDIGVTSPGTGEGRTMQEQLSRATQDA